MDTSAFGNKGSFDDSIQNRAQTERNRRSAIGMTRWRPMLFHVYGARRCDSIAISDASLYRGPVREKASQYAAAC
ncbi:hypothetical protein PMI06_004134 [Burkholderia sp. BT03]|nr:hypothetical protein PMI06_004134 [Burkholderia sp. BT03]SKC71946.1 hypothetical protein SAMN05445504_1406 [Burkholderia sp. CF099]SKC98220.1 hypothetical protein SAMN06266956_7713 [Paraburkholderia hospita]